MKLEADDIEGANTVVNQLLDNAPHVSIYAMVIQPR